MAAAALAPNAGDARITARPIPPHLQAPQPPATPGRQVPTGAKKSQLVPLDVEPGSSRDGSLFIPSTYDHKQRSPLLLMLHGACASGSDCAHVFKWEELEKERLIMLLPDSRGRTWALKRVFENFNIHPQKVCCAGFSDGASYALSIGLPNGGKGIWKEQVHGPFTHIMALSPGFMRPPSVSPIKPNVYISHGIGDQVLDISHCSRRIVSRLASMGFPPPGPGKDGLLHYHEFTGGHCIPAKIASQALAWFVNEHESQAK